MSPTENPFGRAFFSTLCPGREFPGCPVDCHRLFADPAKCALVRTVPGTPREAGPKHSSGSCDDDAHQASLLSKSSKSGI